MTDYLTDINELGYSHVMKKLEPLNPISINGLQRLMRKCNSYKVCLSLYFKMSDKIQFYEV